LLDKKYTRKNKLIYLAYRNEKKVLRTALRIPKLNLKQRIHRKEKRGSTDQFTWNSMKGYKHRMETKSERCARVFFTMTRGFS